MSHRESSLHFCLLPLFQGLFRVHWTHNEEIAMPRKRFTAEQIIRMLNETEERLSRGEEVDTICRSLGITEQTYYRWREDYGGMKTSQVRRLVELERKNRRLKKEVAELRVDIRILKDRFGGKP